MKNRLSKNLRAAILAGVLAAVLVILLIDWRVFTETPGYRMHSGMGGDQTAVQQVEKSTHVRLVPTPTPHPAEITSKTRKQTASRKVNQTPTEKTPPDMVAPSQSPPPDAAADAAEPAVDVDPVQLGSQMTGGGALLGDFPMVVAEYRRTIGFATYRAALSRLGAKFFVLDESSRHLVGQIDLPSGAVYAADTASTRGLSPRSRTLDNEPALSAAMATARKYCPTGTCNPVVLYPVELDLFVVGSIQIALRRTDRDILEFSQFIGTYHLVGGELVLALEYAIDRKGTKTPLPIELNMNRRSISGV